MSWLFASLVTWGREGRKQVPDPFARRRGLGRRLSSTPPPPPCKSIFAHCRHSRALVQACKMSILDSVPASRPKERGLPNSLRVLLSQLSSSPLVPSFFSPAPQSSSQSNMTTIPRSWTLGHRERHGQSAEAAAATVRVGGGSEKSKPKPEGKEEVQKPSDSSGKAPPTALEKLKAQETALGQSTSLIVRRRRVRRADAPTRLQHSTKQSTPKPKRLSRRTGKQLSARRCSAVAPRRSTCPLSILMLLGVGLEGVVGTSRRWNC